MLTALRSRAWTYFHPNELPRAVYVGDGRLLVKTLHGPLLIASRDLSLLPFLALNGTFEDELACWLRDNLGLGSTFVDVGANVGWFTTIAARAVGPTGRVVAVEADPRNYELLLDNISINYQAGWVTAMNVAAWHRAGSLTFHASGKFRGNGSVSAPDAEYRRRYPSDSPVELTVEGVRLDDALADLDHIDVLKMDIEGAEAFALEGLEATIEAGRLGAMIIEINPSASGDAWERLSLWLKRRMSCGWTATDLSSGAALSAEEVVDGKDYANVLLRA